MRKSLTDRALATVFAFLQLTLAAAGCATNPVTGDREFILMSTETEKEIDAEAARQVAAQLGLVEDPVLAAYVDELGQRLARNAPRQDVRYHFHVVAMDEPNAFALPGGHIYVSRGLLLLSNSEAELAGVLGHEIGHVEARHAAQRDALQKTLAVMSILGSVGMAVGGPTSTGMPGPIGTPGYFAFSRAQESQADQIGMELAVDAGFDPRGIGDFLSSLEAHHRLHQGYSRATGYFDSHPATAERAAVAANEAEVRGFTPTFSIRRDRREYLALIDGLSIGTPAREGVVIDRRFLHADLGLTVRFPPGYEVRNTRAAVLGFSPNRKGIVAFEFEASGDDVLAAAQGYAERAGVRLESLQPVKLGDLDAVRAHTVYGGPGARSPAVITWIVFEEQVYRLTALARGGGAPDVNALAANFARSFRALTDDERSEIAAPELSLAEAFSGESLAALSARTDNEWTVNETAVQNGLVATDSLEGGQIVKISKSVRYPASDEATVEVVIPGEDRARETDDPTPEAADSD